MPAQEWLKKEFSYGYDSGDVTAQTPDRIRMQEEMRIGGSYHEVFCKAISPNISDNSKVLELGPGKGSWTKAILSVIPEGEIHTVDFQDVRPWINDHRYEDRLVCHWVEDNSFSSVPDNYFDFFWSMGVLCHNNIADIENILSNALPKMRPGAIAIHQYADWDKLEKFGWSVEKSGIPIEFKNMSDDEMWWPRNNQNMMKSIAEKTGWEIIHLDINLLKRDSLIYLRRAKR